MGFMGANGDRPEIQLNFSSKMISEAIVAHFLKKQHPMSAAQPQSRSESKWEKVVAGGAAGFAYFAIMHPFDVVKTRFQVNDGRISSNIPTYKGTAHALLTIGRCEGFKGLYAGFLASMLGSAVSSSLSSYFSFVCCRNCIRLVLTEEACFPNYWPNCLLRNHLFYSSPRSSFCQCYRRAKQRYSKNMNAKKLSPGLDFLSTTEAEALACLCTNPIWVIKTRLQLQTPLHRTRPYAGIYDAFRTIMREEGWRALCKGLVPHFFLMVSHGAIQLTAYGVLHRVLVESRRKQRSHGSSYNGVLNSYEFAVLGGCSTVVATIMTYPFQVIGARLQQRPSMDGLPKYMGSWHVVKETARFEGLRGFYKGIIPYFLKIVPATSVAFIVHGIVLKSLKLMRSKD